MNDTTVYRMTRERAEDLFHEVDPETKQDLARAMAWALGKLTSHEGAGHIFQILSDDTGVRGVVCRFGKPHWSGSHVSRSMDTGSEAVVMATCEYLVERE